MPKTRIVVTDAQVEAARMIVDHDKALGRETPESIRKIAEAVPQVTDLALTRHSETADADVQRHHGATHTPEAMESEEHHASGDRAVDPAAGHTAGVLAHIEESFADHSDKARTDAPDATHSGWSVQRSGSTGGKFVLKRGTSGKYHFNLVAANGHVIATSETYERKVDALRGIESVKRDALDAQIEDRPGAAD